MITHIGGDHSQSNTSCSFWRLASNGNAPALVRILSFRLHVSPHRQGQAARLSRSSSVTSSGGPHERGRSLANVQSSKNEDRSSRLVLCRSRPKRALFCRHYGLRNRLWR